MSDETTTIETITAEQIEELRTEAGAAGDDEMKRICTAALGGFGYGGCGQLGEKVMARALVACVEAIREAELAS